jgi:hypothetical protein
LAIDVMTLRAVLEADTKPFQKGMEGAQKTAHRAGQTIGKAAKFAGLAVATGLGITAKIGFDEWRQGAAVAAQTNAVIKSTGGVANVSSKHVESLGGSLMRLSGTDDEVVKSGENMLLTFRNIHNQVGKGNDVFDQATKATLDMSVAMKQDMSKSAILVGKALNDPVRGLSALRRVGVTFTKAQEDQIRTMVKSGNVMGAQKVILKELNTEFGGSAAAAGKADGGMRVLKERFKNMAGDLVAKVIPALIGSANFLGRHTTLTKVAAGVVGGLTAALLLAGGALKLYSIAQRTAALFTTATNAALIAQKVLIATSVIGALILLGIALVVLYKKSATFRKVVTAVWKAVKDGALTMVTMILRLFGFMLTALSKVLHVMGKMPGPLGKPFRIMAAEVDKARGKIDQLRHKVDSLKSKNIHVKVVVQGLGYLAALAEHLALLKSKTVTVTTQTRDGRAAGGPVTGGRAYIVGEKRPELFVPRTSGMIIPRVPMLAGGGGSRMSIAVNINGPVYGADSVELSRMLVPNIKAELTRWVKRGGGF